jgi:hypothetical protein
MRLALTLVIGGLFAITPFGQTTTRPAIIPAFTPREPSPAFVVECHNDAASSVPWPTIRKIRLDGNEHELLGGIVGSLLGAPGERFEVAPGAIHHLLFVLSPGGTSSSPSEGLGARVRQGWTLTIARGSHRLAVECLGRWSDEIAFLWSPDGPLGC